MSRLFVFTLIILFSACKNKPETPALSLKNLVGKWKVSQINSEYIIEIKEDSTFSIYTYDSSADMVQKITHFDTQNITLNPIKNTSPNERTTIYNFSIDKDKLILLDQATKEETKATNCLSANCDEQKDYFRKINVEIDLPFVSSNKVVSRSIENTDIKIYIGKPKKPYAMQQGTTDRLSIGEKFIEFKYLPFTIDAAFSRLPDTIANPTVVAFIDKNAKMSAVAELVLQLSKYDTKSVYFVLKKSEDVSQKLDLSLAKYKVEGLKISETESSFLEWLTTQK